MELIAKVIIAMAIIKMDMIVMDIIRTVTMFEVLTETAFT